jgi:hypothetical protein
VGVILTAVNVGYASYYVLEFSTQEAMLLAAIVSSTDAAAVFSILRSRQIKPERRTPTLLELESGSNDHMAIFLTTRLIRPDTQRWRYPCGGSASIPAGWCWRCPQLFSGLSIAADSGGRDRPVHLLRADVHGPADERSFMPSAVSEDVSG